MSTGSSARLPTWTSAAALTPDHVDTLAALLKDEFYIDTASLREAIERGTSFNVIHLSSMEKCDIFIHRADAWGREQMSTRVTRKALPGEADAVWIESAACTILQKLPWYQSGGGVSDRQWRDILGMLKTGAKDLNPDYLKYWAAHLGISDERAPSFEDAGLAEWGR